jgi:asparagine synthetase A
LGIRSLQSISDLTAFKRIGRIEKLLAERKDEDPKKIQGIVLDHFHWHRVIMDEGHELICDHSIGSKLIFTSVTWTDFYGAEYSITRFQKTYAWYMSGTPFPSV